MRIIIDQQLPPLVADWLRAEGFDAVHVREIGLKDQQDHDIWTETKRLGTVVVSRGSDFVNFARQDLDGRLIWLRVGNCTNPDLIAVFEAAWPEAWARLREGERLVEIRR